MEITAAALAAELCGASQEDPLLAVLCEAAEAAWESRLDPGVTKEDCGGGLAVLSELSDFTFVEEKNGKLFVNSPNALDGNNDTKLDTASAAFQAEAGVADFTGDDIHYASDHDFVGIEFSVHGPLNGRVRVGMPGKFNADNALAALAVCSLALSGGSGNLDEKTQKAGAGGRSRDHGRRPELYRPAGQLDRQARRRAG